MCAIKVEETVGFLVENGAKIIDVKRQQNVTLFWVNCQYFVTKQLVVSLL